MSQVPRSRCEGVALPAQWRVAHRHGRVFLAVACVSTIDAGPRIEGRAGWPSRAASGLGIARPESSLDPVPGQQAAVLSVNAASAVRVRRADITESRRGSGSAGGNADPPNRNLTRGLLILKEAPRCDFCTPYRCGGLSLFVLECSASDSATSYLACEDVRRMAATSA